MRVRPTVTAAAFTVAAFAMMAPQALAETEVPTAPHVRNDTEPTTVPDARTDGQPSLSINPSPGRPGQSVVVSVSGGCAAESATASSDAFTESVPLSTGSAGIYTGTGTIRADARAGSHSVNVSCPGGGTSTYSITVAGATSPERGVRAGTGGSLGTDALYVGAGVALVLVAGGYTAYRMRRR
ncbi:hypothetical protein [Streptomyces sp. NPDC003006]